nr:UvrD-like helicase, ATP-binding domain, P-loop containing nucleoside triphosphate hydrolase [Tanacetum cinerariifolium]
MRSKEDELLKIGTSVFVANFPDHFIAKDLWNTYKQYGTSWTLLSLTEDRKQEKRFSFVRFIKIFNVERLVKDFASLSNLKVVLVKDGYDNIKLKYMGGSCVIIEFQSQEAKKRFQSNVGIGTWFSQLQQASIDFIIDGRVTWVKIEGIPLKKWQGFWVRAKEIPGWVPNFMEDNDEETDTDEDTNEGESNGEYVGLKNFLTWEGDSDEEAIPDTKFKEEISKTNVEEVSVWQKDAHSADTFNLYDLLNKKQDENNKGQRR